MAGEGEKGITGVLTEFVEAKEVESLIRDLPNVCDKPNDLEFQIERYKKLLDYYQAQPHLIDPHLSRLLEILVDLTLTPENPKLAHASSSFASHLIKVRGFKVVVRHLPHEVRFMEAVLQLLEQQKDAKQEEWETRYFLLLWLSILVLIPFHLSRFDSGQGGDQASLMNRILNAIKDNLKLGDKCQDAAAFLSAKFLTRPEIVAKFLPEFLDWALLIVTKKSSDRTDDVIKTGALKSIAAIYKHGKREDLLQYAPTILKSIQDAKLDENKNVVIQKLGVKLIQRLGLTFLKAKVASWRYQRGSRSLALNLDETKKAKIDNKENVTEEEDEDYDIPDEIEEVIEYLLEGLRSPETVIR